MNKNTDEKSSRIYLRVSQKEKKKITELANSCGLSVAEYLRKRALGYGTYNYVLFINYPLQTKKATDFSVAHFT